MKYKLFENRIPLEVLEYLREYTSYVKEITRPYRDQPKENGSGIYWKGTDMASSLPIATKAQNQKLFEVFTSNFMYDVVTEVLPNPYLYNDQIVVKEPMENFHFDEHYDNQFGPGEYDRTIVTMNFMLVLDDFTEENGAISVFDEKWITLYPKAGDILMIEGFTPHKSRMNVSDKSRRAYLCVYSNRAIGDWQMGFYNEKFKPKYV